ncbi:MAG: fibronectin type III domain-containing protein [bacterium]|nr:fibronectin type III domain-containing protein [bacterium]
MAVLKDNLKKDSWDEELLGGFSEDLSAKGDVPVRKFEKPPEQENKKSGEFFGAKKIKTFLPLPAKNFLLPAASSVVAAMLIAAIFAYGAPLKKIAENGMGEVVKSVDSAIATAGDLFSDVSGTLAFVRFPELSAMPKLPKFESITLISKKADSVKNFALDEAANAGYAASGAFDLYINTINGVGNAYVAGVGVAGGAAANVTSGLSASVSDAVSGFFKIISGGVKSILPSGGKKDDTARKSETAKKPNNNNNNNGKAASVEAFQSESAKVSGNENQKQSKLLQGELSDLRGELEKIKKAGLVIEGPVVQKTVVEKTIEKIVSGMSSEEIRAELQKLKNKLTAQIIEAKNFAASGNSANFRAIALTQKIDSLSGATLNNTTFTGTVSGLNLSYLPLSGGTLTGALTGTSASFSGNLTVSGSTILNGVTYAWPSADGSSGQVLSTDGSGTLSWSTVSLSAAGGWTDSGTTVGLTTSSDNVGIGTSTPYAKLSVWGSGTSGATAFNVADNASTTLFSVLDNGFVGIGSTTPMANLGIVRSSTNTTAGNEYASYLNFSDTGAVTTGTDNTYGQYVNVSRTGATGGTFNTYGMYAKAAGASQGISRAYGGYFYASGADTNYGAYAQGSQYGVYGYGSSTGGIGVYGTSGSSSGYGVYSYASGNGGVALYGDMNGTTAGNSLKLFSDTITSSNLTYLTQDTSAFTGTGLKMNFANGSGSFTGNFLDLQNNSVSKMRILSTGAMTVATTTQFTNTVLSVEATSTNAIPLTIQGYPSQTANLFQIQDSSAAGLFTVDPSGNVGIASTSPYAKLSVAGQAVITATTTIGVSSTAQQAGIQIGYGGLCVDNDGSCTASTTGRVSAVDYTTGSTDLAEIYYSSEALEPGDIIAAAGGSSITLASQSNKEAIIGAISTKPGIILGMENDYPQPDQYPVALSGRVPVKVNDEGGEIKVGDAISLSSVSGVGKKAEAGESVIGKALEPFNGSGQGKILVFVNLGSVNGGTNAIAEGVDWFLDQFKNFGIAMSDGVMRLKKLVVDTVEVKKELCIDDVCVNRDELKTLLDNAGISRDSGSAAASTPDTVDTIPPSVPENLTAIATTSPLRINLNWVASRDNIGVSGYRIYKDEKLLATTATTSYSDTNLATSTVYTYTISAVDAAKNESAVSIPVTVTVTSSEQN